MLFLGSLGSITEAQNGQPPTVITEEATQVLGRSATIVGSINPNGLSTVYYFQWGTTTAYGNALPAGFMTGQSSPLVVDAQLANLNPSTTYHYQLVATNSAGSAVGEDRTFFTLAVVQINSDFFTYSTNDGAITIAAYSGPGGLVRIPDTIVGLPVICIGDSAFWGSSLTSLNLPEGVKAIGGGAFIYSASLTNIVMPRSLTYIGDHAFCECGALTKVIIPDGVTNIDRVAFWNCASLASLRIGASVVRIGGGAFRGCTSLSHVEIPDSVTAMTDELVGPFGNGGVFSNCSNLVNVVVGKGLTHMGDGAFASCPKLEGVFFRGNAPSLGQGRPGVGVFVNSRSAIVYYLPGTTGWHTSFSSVRTMLWNPTLQPGGFEATQNKFEFNITGTADIPLVIEACPDFDGVSWVPLQSCRLTNGLIHFSDMEWDRYSRRYYRVRAP